MSALHPVPADRLAAEGWELFTGLSPREVAVSAPLPAAEVAAQLRHLLPPAKTTRGEAA